ncbi:MAG: CHAT domain-containing protein [Cyanobacteria bacterium P01_E01_bin.42]
MNRTFVALTLASLLGVGGWVALPARGQTTEEPNLTEEEQAQLEEAARLNREAIELYEQGRYGEAEPLFRQALEMYKRLLGEEHPSVATSLNNLAELYRSQGKYEEAELRYRQALEMYKRVLGEEHPSVATSLNNLALLYRSQGKYEEAELRYRQALEMLKRLLGEEHPHVATSLNNLAALYENQGKYEEAELRYRQALEMLKRVLGEEHPHVATSLNNLAALYQSQGRYEEAELRYRQALEMYKRVLGEEHPSIANNLNNLAVLYQSQGRYGEALNFFEAGVQVEEYNLKQNLIAGSERQKQAYLNTLSWTRNTTIALHLHQAPNNAKAARLAFTTLSQRKGRLLDFFTQTRNILRQQLDRQSQTLLDRLNANYRQLSNLTLNPSQNLSTNNYRTQIDTLNQQIQDLEDQIGRRSREFRQITQPITLAAIQKRLPQDSALVEFVQYSHEGNQHYAAYILTPEGNPQGIDLGEVEALDRKLIQLRFSLQDPKTNLSQVQDIAREVHRQILTPLYPHLGNAKHLLISPDGNLNTIPFESLIDENGNYLLETHTLTYLTSGRDLFRLHSPDASLAPDAPLTPPVIMGNPDFNNPGELLATLPSREFALPETRSPQQLNAQTWGLPPIPETETEAIAIADLLNVSPLLKTQASEETLKQIDRPSILHIATHGFFREKPPSNNPGDNPLLWSGLVLAGMKSEGGIEDGLLTALETTGLRLDGTQLVVLSACDTGLGGVARGEGIYGLRRALVIAGAESQVMSLWKVSDRATQELMVAYYQNLKENNAGRSEGLREIKLKMVRGEMNEDYKHPYYWASFIPSGNWSPMQF